MTRVPCCKANWAGSRKKEKFSHDFPFAQDICVVKNRFLYRKLSKSSPSSLDFLKFRKNKRLPFQVSKHSIIKQWIPKKLRKHKKGVERSLRLSSVTLHPLFSYRVHCRIKNDLGCFDRILPHTKISIKSGTHTLKRIINHYLSTLSIVLMYNLFHKL